MQNTDKYDGDYILKGIDCNYMCNVITIDIDGKTIKVADIKQDCIRNIVDAAKKCDYIDKIVLFGSSIESRCTEKSDVDIAVFGNITKYRCLSSKKYRDFTAQLYRFDDHSQSYDILYFKTGKKDMSPIYREIEKGETIYAK